jgi:RNA polymerase sigma-70 factor (ECF subfamily)
MTPAAIAVEALVHQYYKLVFHTIYGLTNNWEESQDLTQDTCQQALKGIDAARASSGEQFNPKAWLLRIALNTVRMQHRRRAILNLVPFSAMRERKAEMGAHSTGDESIKTLQEQALPVQPGGFGSNQTHDPAETIAERDAVQRTMARLSEEFRVCLLLSIVAGLSNSEIATLLNMKEPAVRQRLARARKQFQQFYSEMSGNTLSDPMHATYRIEEQQKKASSALPQQVADTHKYLPLNVCQPVIGHIS